MSTIYADNIKPNLQDGVHIPGHVIQTKFAKSTTITTTDSATGAVATNLAVQFTPLRSNSVILITIMAAAESSGSYSDRGFQGRIYRDSTQIYTSEYDLYMSSDTTQRIQKVTYQYYEDSPGTDQVTYTFYIQSTGASTSNSVARFNQYGEPSTMVIQEIAQ
jgi:hypothetical protein